MARHAHVAAAAAAAAARLRCCACILLLAASAAAADEQLDVCIVGAGPAGIGAATALAAKGRSVALVERAAVAGGQAALEYRNNGWRLHMGAIVLTPPDYPLIMAAAQHVGIGVEVRRELCDA